MSILGTVGSAAKTVTDEATQNPLGNAIDSVARGLTGSSGSAPSGTPRFVDAAPIDEVLRPASFALHAITQGMPKPSHRLTLQIDRYMQFLHLCHAHRAEPANFSGGAISQGAAMRDALVREAVLLHSFVCGTQSVLTKVTASKGATGAMLDTASSLAGGSTQAAPGPEAFAAIVAQIRSAIDPVNQASFNYPALHSAGKALGQAADAYHEHCKTALSAKKGGGAGLPSIPGLSSALGKAGMPEIIGKLPEWLFKAQDAYLAMHAATCQAYEWPLMKISHDYSLQAIRGRWQPSYDIWRLRNHEATEAAVQDNPSLAENLLGTGIAILEDKSLNHTHSTTDLGIGKNAAEELAKAQKTIADQRHQAQDQMAKFVGLLDTARNAQADMPPEAVAALTQACALLRGKGKTGDAQSADAPKLGEVLAHALGQSLAGGTLPGFMTQWCLRMGDLAVDLLEGVFNTVHASSQGPHPAVVLMAVNQSLTDKLVGELFKLITGDDNGPGRNNTHEAKQNARDAVDDLSQLNLGAAMRKTQSLVPDKEALANRSAELLSQFLAAQAQQLNGIVFFVASELHQELTEAWMQAHGKNAMSMEAYLGRLPALAATLTRNLIFPVFNLLLQVFGLGDKLAGAVWDPVSEGIGRVTETTQTVRQTKDDIRQAGEDIQSASERVDEQLFGDKDSTQKKMEDHKNNLTRFDEHDIAEGFSGKHGQFNNMMTDVKNTPGDIANAARGEPDASTQPPAAPAGSNANNANGPLSAMREKTAQAKPVDKEQLDQTSPLKSMAEKEFLIQRSAEAVALPPVPQLGLAGI